MWARFLQDRDAAEVPLCLSVCVWVCLGLRWSVNSDYNDINSIKDEREKGNNRNISALASTKRLVIHMVVVSLEKRIDADGGSSKRELKINNDSGAVESSNNGVLYSVVQRTK